MSRTAISAAFLAGAIILVSCSSAPSQFARGRTCPFYMQARYSMSWQANPFLQPRMPFRNTMQQASRLQGIPRQQTNTTARNMQLVSRSSPFLTSRTTTNVTSTNRYLTSRVTTMVPSRTTYLTAGRAGGVARNTTWLTTTRLVGTTQRNTFTTTTRHTGVGRINSFVPRQTGIARKVTEQPGPRWITTERKTGTTERKTGVPGMQHTPLVQMRVDIHGTCANCHNCSGRQNVVVSNTPRKPLIPLINNNNPGARPNPAPVVRQQPGPRPVLQPVVPGRPVPPAIVQVRHPQPLAPVIRQQPPRVPVLQPIVPGVPELPPVVRAGPRGPLQPILRQDQPNLIQRPAPSQSMLQLEEAPPPVPALGPAVMPLLPTPELGRPQREDRPTITLTPEQAEMPPQPVALPGSDLGPGLLPNLDDREMPTRPAPEAVDSLLVMLPPPPPPLVPAGTGDR